MPSRRSARCIGRADACRKASFGVYSGIQYHAQPSAAQRVGSRAEKSSTRMPRKPIDRPNPCFTFLRRLRAGGRSNMYGAIPYLIDAFGCDRAEAFGMVCEWLDAQAAADAASAPEALAPTRSVVEA